MTTLYHGSYISVQNPLTGVGRKELDFGPGFYMTSLRDQAERWARRICIIRAVDTPILSTYELDEDALPNHLRLLNLAHYDQSWLDFIVSSRRGEEPWKDYDIIEGGVANDRVVDTVNLYMAGLMDKVTALRRLSEHKPNNQMCLLNQKITDKYLIFDGTKEI